MSLKDLSAMPPIYSVHSGQYVLEKRLGAGVCGVVYKGHDVKTGEAVAIKLEPRGDIKKRFLEYEAQQMRNLRTPFTPEFKAFGCEHSYRYMVVELLGPSLHMLRQRSPTFTFDKETVVLLAIQLLFAIEYIHGMNVVHQDIKADNIVLRSDQPNLINIIDFGVCGPFKDHLGRHLPSRPSLFFPGTAEFSSVKAHRDLAQTRQDDLESIVYTLVDLATHDLPWCVPGLSFRRIAEVKATTSPEQICAGLPPEFAHMLTYARRLEYSARPDYSGLRAAFVARYRTMMPFHYGKMQWVVHPWTFFTDDLPGGLLVDAPLDHLRQLDATVASSNDGHFSSDRHDRRRDFSTLHVPRKSASPMHGFLGSSMMGTSTSSSWQHVVAAAQQPQQYQAHLSRSVHTSHRSHFLPQASMAPASTGQALVVNSLQPIAVSVPQPLQQQPSFSGGRQVLLRPGQFHLPTPGVIYQPHNPLAGVLLPSGEFLQTVV